ncbi:MAG: type II secretion system GspH family protein [Candidatus Omnitrophica bacterium]|nr:type II secretion system GspH family protein [Candidatus Omnitrophota bacterium]MCF7894120.1 type II secretion system GspH family protein [Candidatus Omnitrophota bacterium]
MEKKSSFTLIELVTVVGVVALLSVTIGVTLMALSPKKLEVQTRKMVSMLSWARELSAAYDDNHDNYFFSFDTTEKEASFYKGSISPANLIKKEHFGLDSFSLDRGGVSVTDLEFKTPYGTTNSSQKTIITLNYKDESAEITIYPDTGFIKWEKT